MAGEVRPVVFLMLLGSLLFVADGILDGAYPGGGSWFGEDHHYGLGALTYVFALANAAFAVLIARGSERGLMGRIGFSAFFLIERPLTAVGLGPKSAEAIAVHAATAVIELVILLGAVRVWRLGHSVESMDPDSAFDLDSPSPAVAAVDDDAPPEGLGQRSAWTLGLITLLLAAVLVADGVWAGFVPGGRQWGLTGDATGWLVYLFAVVALTAALPAIHGRTLALRILFALALIFFIERAFAPLVLRTFDPTSLALHVLGAFVALALALVAAGAIRRGGARRGSRAAPPRAA